MTEDEATPPGPPTHGPDDAPVAPAAPAEPGVSALRSPARPVWWRREGRAFIELLALTGFAVAQPLLDIFGRSPDQFVFRGAEGGDIVRFGLIVALVPPIVLWIGELLVGFVSSFLRRVVHVAALAVLVGTFAVQVARPLGDGVLLYLIAAAVAAGAVVLYLKAKATTVWLAFASIAPPVFLALFLLTSQTAELIDPKPVGAANAVINRPAPVVMVVFDELPLNSLVDADGTIDADLFPNFARLASQSHWFRNTTSVSNSTWHAVPALATGRIPQDGTAPTAKDHPNSLFTLLGGAYDLKVTESVTRLCPTDLCDPPELDTGGLDELVKDAGRVMKARLSPDGARQDAVAGLVEAQGGEQAKPETSGGGFDDFGLNQPARVTTFLDGLKDTSNTLHYLHVLLPHVPYRYLPSGRQYPYPDPDLARNGDMWADQPWPVALARQRHLLQLQYVDGLVGQVLDTMQQRGMLDDSLLIVTADHGVSFEAGQPIRGIEKGETLNDQVAADLMWVPLFVKEPGEDDGDVSDANTTTVDVLPTIADVLDIDLPWKVDGRSVLGPPRTSTTKTIYRAEVNGFGVSAGQPYRIDEKAGWKLVLARAVDRFLPPGTGTDAKAERPWRLGPSRELVGTKVADAPSGRLTAAAATFDRSDDFGSVEPDSGTVPSLVRGTLQNVPAGTALAVAVNGTIEATAPAYQDGDAVKFAVVVSDASFRAGANDVQVLRIVPS